MKTFQSFLFSTLLTLCFSFQSAHAFTPESSLRDKVISYISTDHWGHLESGDRVTMELTFSLKECGGIQVLDVQAAHKEDEQLLRSRLKDRKVKLDGLEINTPYKLTITVVKE